MSLDQYLDPNYTLYQICVSFAVQYTFLSSTPGLNGNEALSCRGLMGMNPAASVGQRSASMRHVKLR